MVSANHLWQRISDCVDELGFPPGLDFHSLRRSYATHLLTSYRYDIKFIQMQLGHEHAATTSIYTLPAADFQIAELARVRGRPSGLPCSRKDSLTPAYSGSSAVNDQV